MQVSNAAQHPPIRTWSVIDADDGPGAVPWMGWSASANAPARRL